MGYCPADCADFTLVGNPTAGCAFELRKRTISRLLFMPCDIALPSPFTAANTAPLFANKSIVASSPLADVVVNDPETEDIIIHDCAPAEQIVNRRILTANDKIAIEVADDPATSGVNEATKYFDYRFWKDKKLRRLLLRYGVAFCNGDVILARDANGALLEATLQAFLSYQKLANNGGTIEFKKIQLAFSGDFLDFREPDFNLVDFGINL